MRDGYGKGKAGVSVTLRDIADADYAFCAVWNRDGRMLAAFSLPVTTGKQRVELTT